MSSSGEKSEQPASIAASEAVQTSSGDTNASSANASSANAAKTDDAKDAAREQNESATGDDGSKKSENAVAGDAPAVSVDGDDAEEGKQQQEGGSAKAEATKGKQDAVDAKPPPKKRGRKPKKDKEGAVEAMKRAKLTAFPVKAKRGRPSKKALEERAAALAAIAAAAAAEKGTEEEEQDKQDDAANGGEEEGSADKPKKRKSPAGRKPKKDKEQDASTAAAEETESEPEKQPKKKAKTSTAKPTKEKKSPGRKKKSVKKAGEEEEESDSEDETQKEVVKRVEALDPDVKSKFGEIVWAKMTGYPYWPALITDPRHLPPKLQAPAMKDLDTKYLVYFYAAKNFAPTLFKNVEPWDDKKNDYREGFPVKDSKAPKRRAQLMEAIAEADKEVLLPVEERVDGLLKPVVKERKPKREARAAAEPGTPEKRRGRPPGSKSVNKTAKLTARKSKKKSEETEENEAEEETDEPAQASPEEEEEEDPVAKSLSKEEIKAKIASRKTPSKKKAGVDEGDSKSKSASGSKKASATSGKAGGKTTASSDDIDSKRKKEIELVVPRKSVKSADIREMSAEAAKKKLGGQKEKTKKDKGDYKVGDLGSFASKLTRFHANESSKNNDELIQMLNQLFDEKVVYRSDVERSGLAAIIAVLRKSSNPTVAQTASALRKHLMKIIEHDTSIDKSASKPSEGKKAATAKDAKTSEKKEDGTRDAKKESSSQAKEANGVSKSKQVDKSAKIVEAKAKVESTSESLSGRATPAMSKDSTTEQSSVKSGNAKDTAEKEGVASPKVSSEAKDENTKSEVSEESEKAEAKAEKEDAPAKKSDDGAKASDASLDKNRQAFVDMLSNVLELSGPGHLKLAKEIEEFVFDRYKESNDDYMVQARMITFGLKGNKNLRDRLFSGSLHGLELVYADDKFFEATP